VRKFSVDVTTIFLPIALQWRDYAIANPEAEVMGDMVRIQTLVPHRGLATPFHILRYFGYNGTPGQVGEFVWEMVEDIRMEVFRQMLALTGEEYRLDWSRIDKAFCLWYRHRAHQRDATRSLHFVRSHTVQNIPHTEIRDSSVHGFGLFAIQTIPQGQVLAVLDGQIMSFDEYELLRVNLGRGLGRLRLHFFMEWNALDGDRLLVRPLRTAYSYINHSTNPNIEAEIMERSVTIRAIRQIEPDQELLLDYRKEPLPRGYFENPESVYLKPAPVLEDDEACDTVND